MSDFTRYELVKRPRSQRRCDGCLKPIKGDAVKIVGVDRDCAPGILTAWSCQECHAWHVGLLEVRHVHVNAPWTAKKLARARAVMVKP